MNLLCDESPGHGSCWSVWTCQSKSDKPPPTCSFSCVSSSNSLSASARVWGLSRVSRVQSSQDSCGSGPPQTRCCSSQPSWELPSRGFTPPEDSGSRSAETKRKRVKLEFLHLNVQKTDLLRKRDAFPERKQMKCDGYDVE